MVVHDDACVTSIQESEAGGSGIPGHKILGAGGGGGRGRQNALFSPCKDYLRFYFRLNEFPTQSMGALSRSE